MALAVAGVMIEEGWFDAVFVRDWTNGPQLVRDDDGTLLRAEALASGTRRGFVAWDEACGAPVRYDPVADAYEHPPARLALSPATGAGRNARGTRA